MLFWIDNWDADFENSRSRARDQLNWVPIPNKTDGDGYIELVDHPEGAAHLGAWTAIVKLASRCYPRGALIRSDGRPHDATSIARKARLPQAVFESLLPRVLAPEIAWLRSCERGGCCWAWAYAQGSPGGHSVDTRVISGCQAGAGEVPPEVEVEGEVEVEAEGETTGVAVDVSGGIPKGGEISGPPRPLTETDLHPAFRAACSRCGVPLSEAAALVMAGRSSADPPIVLGWLLTLCRRGTKPRKPAAWLACRVRTGGAPPQKDYDAAKELLGMARRLPGLNFLSGQTPMTEPIDAILDRLEEQTA